MTHRIWTTCRIAITVALTTSLALLALPAEAVAADDTYTVASKNFNESVVLGEIVRGLLGTKGFDAAHREQLGGTRVCWEALTQGEIDIYPEYTGTIREELFADTDIENDDELRDLLADDGVSMSRPLGFENTYALGIPEQRASELDIKSVSDLRDHPQLVYAFSNEFAERADGWDALQQHYDLEPDDVRSMEHDLIFPGVEAGDVDVVVAYTTEAAIEHYDLRILDDDRSFFPDYDAVLLYRTDLGDSAPDAVDAIRQLEAAISEEQMAAMNVEVRIDGRPEAAIAADFLDRQFDATMAVDDIQTRADRIWTRTIEHLFLVGVSMTAAILLSIPLGIWAARKRKIGQGILGIVGILQTIPSLALLVFMIPLFGIGNWPAIAALFLYSLLPIVRNTYSGLKSIPNDVLESARALGLERSAIMRKIELPLAMHSILAGIKISIVINIGVATLGALVGSGGYGQPILTGIRRYDIALILEGAIPAAALAIGAQFLFEAVERALIPRGLRQQADDGQ